MRQPLSIARSMKHRLMVDAPAAVDRSLDPLRHGDRSVLMTPAQGMRLGNFMYLWMRAHGETTAQASVRVLEASAMEPWLREFPALRELTLPRPALRFGDRRDREHPFLYQRFGIDFSRDLLHDFIGTRIRPHVRPDRSADLVLNVRRGDYYSEDSFRGKFGFDQLGYIAAALERAGSAPHVVVVSDDPAWCRTMVGPLLQDRGSSADYAPTDPVANFMAVAGASRLIGTNSTFSYWGGYVAGMVHEAAQIIMPRFHARMPGGTDAYQLDPRWIAIGGFH